MSFGGHVAGMINSLKNNRLSLRLLKERHQYAMDHRLTPVKRKKPKKRFFHPEKVAAIKRKSRRAYLAQRRTQMLILLIFIIIAIISFVFLFRYLSVF